MPEQRSIIRARRGFTILGNGINDLSVQFNEKGSLEIKQDNDLILIPASAVAMFQRAVADLKEIV